MLDSISAPAEVLNVLSSGVQVKQVTVVASLDAVKLQEVIKWLVEQHYELKAKSTAADARIATLEEQMTKVADARHGKCEPQPKPCSPALQPAVG